MHGGFNVVETNFHASNLQYQGRCCDGVLYDFFAKILMIQLSVVTLLYNHMSVGSNSQL